MAKGKNTFDDYLEIIKEIDSGKIYPIYLLQGEETYFLDYILAKLEKKVVDPATASFNAITLYGKDTNASDIVSTCKRFPMMADKQLVVIKEAHQVVENDFLLSYLEKPLESTVLVWFHPQKSVPLNKKIGKSFQKYRVFTAAEIGEVQLPNILQKFIKSKGYDIEPKPLQMVLDKAGGRFTATAKEFEKVFANLPTGSKIREEDIAKYIGLDKKYNIFALQKALAYRNRKSALEIVNFLNNNSKDNPLILTLNTLFSYFRKVTVFQKLKGLTDKELMSQIGIPFFAVSEYRKAASSFNSGQLEQVIEILQDCDLKIKGIKESAATDAELLEETIVKILLL